MKPVAGLASELEALAERADGRAAQARQHAAGARDQARRDAADGDDQAEALHLGEAEAHERAARATEATAALYRFRIRYLRSRGDAETPPTMVSAVSSATSVRPR